MKHICLSLFLLLLITASGCSRSKLPTNSVDSSTGDSLIWINSWQLLGPVDIDLASTLTFTCEDSFVLKGLELSKENNAIRFEPVHLPMQGLSFDKEFPVKSPASVFMACTVRSDENKEMILMFSTFQKGTCWLNGELIDQTKWKDTRMRYREEFTRIPLKKGDNFLLFEISITEPNEKRKRWHLDCCITSPSRGEKLFKTTYNSLFLTRSCIHSWDQLHVYTGIHKNIRAAITDLQGNEIARYRYIAGNAVRNYASLPIPEAPAGIYTCRIFTGKDTLSERFFYGNMDSVFNHSVLKEYRQLNPINPGIRQNTEALINRFRYAYTQRFTDCYESQGEYWDKTRVNVLGDLLQIIHFLKKNQDPFRLGIGGFRAYQLPSSEETHYFTSYFPKIREEEKVPLFIHILTETSDYTESWINHWMNNGSWDDYMHRADKYKVGYIYTNCGGINNQALQQEHFENILQSCIRKLPIDSSRIFIIGNCESTLLTLDLLNKYKKSIAGAGFINPSISPEHFPAVDYFYNKKNNQSLYVLCSSNDENQPVENSILFHKQLENMNKNTQLEVSRETTHLLAPSDYINRMYEYLVNH